MIKIKLFLFPNLYDTQHFKYFQKAIVIYLSIQMLTKMSRISNHLSCTHITDSCQITYEIFMSCRSHWWHERLGEEYASDLGNLVEWLYNCGDFATQVALVELLHIDGRHSHTVKAATKQISEQLGNWICSSVLGQTRLQTLVRTLYKSGYGT